MSIRALPILVALALAAGIACGGGDSSEPSAAPAASVGALTCADLTTRLIVELANERLAADAEGVTGVAAWSRVALKMMSILEGHSISGFGVPGETLFDIARRYDLSVVSDEAVASNDFLGFSQWAMAFYASNGYYLLAADIVRGIEDPSESDAAKRDLTSGRSISIPVCDAVP